MPIFPVKGDAVVVFPDGGADVYTDWSRVGKWIVRLPQKSICFVLETQYPQALGCRVIAGEVIGWVNVFFLKVEGRAKMHEVEKFDEKS